MDAVDATAQPKSSSDCALLPSFTKTGCTQRLWVCCCRRTNGGPILSVAVWTDRNPANLSKPPNICAKGSMSE